MDRKNDGLRLMDGAGYKKIIIACDSYKGCLSSREVNEAIASGVKEWNADDASPEIKKLSPNAASEMKKLDSDDVSPEIITLEMSDGGEGMLDAFLSAMKGERVRIHAHDALMRWIEAEYGIVDDTAIIEIAQTAGLALIEPEQRNPMKATSWGVGEMIMNAYRRGVRRFIVGLAAAPHPIAASECSRRWATTGRRFAGNAVLCWLRMLPTRFAAKMGRLMSLPLRRELMLRWCRCWMIGRGSLPR